MDLNARFARGLPHMYNAHRRIALRCAPGVAINGDPNLKWRLGCQFMKAKCRQQADNPVPKPVFLMVSLLKRKLKEPLDSRSTTNRRIL
jgi:hypothetical protein